MPWTLSIYVVNVIRVNIKKKYVKKLKKGLRNTKIETKLNKKTFMYYIPKFFWILDLRLFTLKAKQRGYCIFRRLG